MTDQPETDPPDHGVLIGIVAMLAAALILWLALFLVIRWLFAVFVR